MAQPLKQINKLPENFSKELTALLDYIVENFMKVNGVNCITPEIFIFMSLEYKDSICYKVINSILNENEIEKLHDEISEIVEYTSDVINGKIDLLKDENFKNVLNLSLKEKDETLSKLITSDHILLSILKINKPLKLFTLLQKYQIEYNGILNISKELHGVTSVVYDNNTKKQNTTNKPNKKQQQTKKIDYCVNLFSDIEYNKVNKTYGLSDEIKQVFTIFGRKNNNNVIIVGDKGVGKTQCVYGVAEKIYNETCPIEFHNKTIWKLNISELYAGTSIRGSLEERIVKLNKQLGSKNDSILFIDDLHTILGHKHASGEIDLSSLFNQLFNNPNIQVICCATYQELKSIKDNNREIIDNFQQVTIEEPSVNKTIQLLTNLKEEYENYHNVKYCDNVIETIVELSKQYISEKFLPLSAIEIIDIIGANKKIHSSSNSVYINTKKDISSLEMEKEILIKKDEIDKCNKIDEEIEKKRNILSNILLKRNKRKIKVTLDDVLNTFSEHTNIPISKLSINEKERIKNLEQIFKEKIIGQDDAVDEIIKAIKRNKVGLSKNKATKLSLLAIGNSGVGKTLIAKTLAKDILGNEKYLVRFDMSEYADETSVNKLIGSSSGYVGYHDGGLLTEAIKRNKYCVLLLDEIEKANQKVFNLFLQILDEGFITDNMGQKVDFKNTYIIMTSNVGTKQALGHKTIGFDGNNINNNKDIIKKEMKHVFPPEFLNRFDNILIFNPLTDNNLKDIIKIELNYLHNRINEIGHTLEFNDDIVEYILKEINDEKEYGARPIKRVIKSLIEDAIADFIINNEIEHYNFKLIITDNKITIK